MKKRVAYRKFSRGKDARRALLRSLTISFLEHGSMVTTKAKGKAVQPVVTKLVVLTRNDTVAARRKAASMLGNDRTSVAKLFGPIAQTFQGTNSGFTKLTNLPRRLGDGAQRVRIEWTKEVVKVEAKPAKAADKKAKPAKMAAKKTTASKPAKQAKK